MFWYVSHFNASFHVKVQKKSVTVIDLMFYLGAHSNTEIHFLVSPKLKPTLTHKHWAKRDSSLKHTSPLLYETCTLCGTTHRWPDTSLWLSRSTLPLETIWMFVSAVNNLSINNGVEDTAKTPVGISGVVCAPETFPAEIIADPVIPSWPPELRLCFWTAEVSLLMFGSIFIKKTLCAQSKLLHKVTL